jgi:hypothetical protein
MGIGLSVSEAIHRQSKLCVAFFLRSMMAGVSSSLNVRFATSMSLTGQSPGL